MTRRLVVTCVAVLGLGLVGCGDDDSGGGGGGGDFCEVASSARTAFDAISSSDAASGSAADLQSVVEGGRDAIDALASTAPGEIADDFEVLSDAYGQLVDVLADVDWDVMALATDPEAAAKLDIVNSAEVQQAVDNIDQYSTAECGFALGNS